MENTLKINFLPSNPEHTHSRLRRILGCVHNIHPRLFSRSWVKHVEWIVCCFHGCYPDRNYSIFLVIRPFATLRKTRWSIVLAEMGRYLSRSKKWPVGTFIHLCLLFKKNCFLFFANDWIRIQFCVDIWPVLFKYCRNDIHRLNKTFQRQCQKSNRVA